MGYKKATAFKMMPKSPIVKALTAKQEANLPPQLKAEIAAAPETVAKLKTDPPKKAHTDEMGREGHFNPYTEKTKGSGRSYTPIESEYPEKYQNKIVGGATGDKFTVTGKIGYKEEQRKSNFKRDNVMGLRAEAYQDRANNFGVKKPKANIKSPNKNYKKGYYGE